MLYLDIQKGKEEIKASYFQQNTGGKAACMNKLMQGTKGCGQILSNGTLLADSWFNGVKTAEKENSEGVDFCGPVETSHKGFFLAKLEKSIKEWPGGSHILMKSSLRVPGDRLIMDIGYKYISQKVLGFIATEGVGSTESGVPYLSRYPDNNYNVSINLFLCPHIIGRYLSECNEIDKMRQYDLALEKYLATQSGFFRLATTVELGMLITDGKPLLCH